MCSTQAEGICVAWWRTQRAAQQTRGAQRTHGRTARMEANAAVMHISLCAYAQGV